MFCRLPPGAIATFGISALREAFKILSNLPDSDALFTKLDETDFPFLKQLSPSVSHRTKRQQEEENQDPEISDPPKIAHKSKRLLTLSKMVTERDIQCGELSSSPDSSQEPVVSSASRPVQKLHDQPVPTQSTKYVMSISQLCFLICTPSFVLQLTLVAGTTETPLQSLTRTADGEIS